MTILKSLLEMRPYQNIVGNSKTKRYFLWAFVIFNIDLILILIKQEEIIEKLIVLLGFEKCQGNDYAVSVFCAKTNDMGICFLTFVAFVVCVNLLYFYYTCKAKIEKKEEKDKNAAETKKTKSRIL